jgi:hypothetical protein
LFVIWCLELGPCLLFGAWNLVLVCYLVLGTWSLFVIWCLELGSCLLFGAWNLVLVCYLVLGTWFLFVIWCLVLGACFPAFFPAGLKGLPAVY